MLKNLRYESEQLHVKIRFSSKSKFLFYPVLAVLVALSPFSAFGRDTDIDPATGAPSADKGTAETKSDRLKPPSCSYAREYITALEYFRTHHEYAIPEKESRDLAFKISHGCTGAAQRFIKVNSTLLRSGVAPKDTLETALFFAVNTDVATETFLAIFLKAFLKEFMDLDASTSLKLAFSLFRDFNGDVLAVKMDFENFVDFCTKTEEINQAIPKCARFAARLARKGEKWDGGIFLTFQKLFSFLLTQKGPGLSTWKALDEAERLLEGGHGAAENYIQAFKYAASKEGLDLEIPKAMAFANQMTLQDSTTANASTQRVPAGK